MNLIQSVRGAVHAARTQLNSVITGAEKDVPVLDEDAKGLLDDASGHLQEALLALDRVLGVPQGHIYTFRTAAEIRALAEERDEHYAAGRTEEGDAVKEVLTYTAVRRAKK
jgi:hypothetical protein